MFRHKINEIYEIEYLGGKIKATGNHSLFIRTKNGLIAKPVVELKPGDILVDLPYKVNSQILRGHNFFNNSNLTLQIHDLQTDTTAYKSVLNGGNLILLSQMTNKSISSMHRWRNGTSSPRELNNYYHNVLPQSVKVTPELMKLFGYYTAEGYSRKELDFCFGAHENYLVEDLKKFERLLSD